MTEFERFQCIKTQRVSKIWIHFIIVVYKVCLATILEMFNGRHDQMSTF